MAAGLTPESSLIEIEGLRVNYNHQDPPGFPHPLLRSILGVRVPFQAISRGIKLEILKGTLVF
jgi:hypothetical protein